MKLVSQNELIRIKRLDPLRAKKIFIRKADGPYLGFRYKSLISDPFNSDPMYLAYKFRPIIVPEYILIRISFFVIFSSPEPEA